jgi:hypothetical protein
MTRKHGIAKNKSEKKYVPSTELPGTCTGKEKGVN